MRRGRYLSVESLEGRALLSSLSYSLTTDASTYQVGQPVKLTFTETNTSNQPLTVNISPTDFTISSVPASAGGPPLVWQSNPSNQGIAPSTEILQPGTSITQTASWNGQAANSATNAISSDYPYGSFIVTNPNAPAGTTAPFQIESPFTATMTTNQSVYQAGTPVQMTFTLTNTSSEPAQIAHGASNTGFIVTQGGQVIWQSNSGIIPMSIVLDTLQPGQSLTFHQTWDGTITNGSNTSTTAGAFVVTNQLNPSAAASFQINSPLSYSVNMPKTVFGPGQPINLSYTITNSSDLPYTFSLAPTDAQVTWNGTTVWDSGAGASSSSQAPTTETLQPAQSLTQTATWNGIANVGTLAGTDVWDDFVVSFAGAPSGLTQAFQITSPLTLSVSTNQSTYQPGQAVLLTATETNTSNAAITVLNTQDKFIIMGNGGVTLPANNGASSNPVATLQPGQSQTFTATWNPGESQSAATIPSGNYDVVFQDNFQGATSSEFVIDGTSTAPIQPPISTGSTSPGQNSGTSGSTSTSGQLPGSSTSASQNASPVAASLTVNRPASSLGHPIRLTIKLKNVTKTSQRLTPNSSTDGITVLDGSTVVSRVSKSLLSSKAKLLKPGQSVQVTSTWNGKPNQAGLKALKPGVYTVVVHEGGYTASTNIQIQ